MSDFDGKTVLITGGTGSFGQTFLKRLMQEKFAEVRVFSRDELKQENMRIELGRNDVKFYIGDVRNRDSLDSAMKNVDYVFHAAALKQVPSCEFFPMEAVMTNIHGSQNVIESSIENKVKKVVCLSTDKAVYPVNAMGMTKGLMEKVVMAAAARENDSGTIVSLVRYGNVMYSRGSVIPLFIKQIREGKPITITVPEMTRFLLPLDSAIELVLHAFSHASAGDIMIKKSPACTIADLAQALIEIFDKDAKTKVIGMRHGEKIYETLASREELSAAEENTDYFRIRMDRRDLNYNLYYTDGDVEESELEDYTSHNTQQLDVEEVKKLLLSLPEVQGELKAG